jgi:hypothetical protein
MHRLFLLLALLSLVSCGDQRRDPPRSRRPVVSLDQPAASRVYPVGKNEVVVINFPEAIGRSTDIRQCFVWRDAEFKTASMQCPSDTAGDIPVTSGLETIPNH